MTVTIPCTKYDRTVIRVQRWLLILAFAMLTHTTAFAEDISFRKVQLAYGISLDIPAHWVVLEEAVRKNIGAAGEAILNNSGVEGSAGRKERLLKVNAVPYPTGAMIGVSVTSAIDYTQADVAAFTAADLNDIGTEMRKAWEKLEASGTPKLLEMQPTRIEPFNNFLALVISYVRADLFGPSPWQVTQYKIPVSNQLIEITLSYRQSDGVLWKPVLERVRRSVRF